MERIIKDIEGEPSINGMKLSYSTMKIRREIEDLFEENKEFVLPEKFNISIIDNIVKISEIAKMEEIKLELEVTLLKEDGHYIISTNANSKKLLGFDVFGVGKNKSKAIKEFWNSFRSINDYYIDRSKELDKWKFIQIGDWSQKAGKWFMLFGITFYFRKGKNMSQGFYIPFTNFNVLIN